MIFQPEEDASASLLPLIDGYSNFTGYLDQIDILSIDTQPHDALGPRAVGSYSPVLQAKAAHTDSAEGGGP